jgi:RNA polymerase sigma factor (sigma-70 family)
VVTDAELEVDRRLLEAARHGDSRARGAIYSRYEKLVYRRARSRVPDDATAWDITQDTFEAFLKKLPTFEWRERPLKAWLIPTADNFANKYWQRTKREVSLEASDCRPMDERQDDLADADRRLDIGEAVTQLPASQQEIIAKRFGEDLSIKQVAIATRRSEGAVKLLQHRALTTLRTSFKQARASALAPFGFLWRAIGTLSPLDLTPQLIGTSGGAVAVASIVGAAIFFNPTPTPGGASSPSTPTPAATSVLESGVRESQPTPTPTLVSPRGSVSPQVPPEGPIDPGCGPEPNDDFANATTICTVPWHADRNIRGATWEQRDPDLACSPSHGASVWFKFTPAVTQSYALSTRDSLYQTVLGVYTGTEESLQSVACDAGSGPGSTSPAHVRMQAGTTYYILVAAAAGGPGGQLSFTISAPEDSVVNPGSCTDGLDNDGDKRIDAADPEGCEGDGDGVPDVLDNCSSVPNPDQRDDDHDGYGDACDYDEFWTDADGDSYLGFLEVTYGSDPQDATSVPEHVDVGLSCADTIDNDGDGQIDMADSGCPQPSAPTQGTPTPPTPTATPDPDWDDDGVLNGDDNCPSHNNPNQANLDEGDANGDSLGDACDDDDDGDGVSDILEERYRSDPRDRFSTPENRLSDFIASCSDGKDNDGDGKTDGDDSYCAENVPSENPNLDFWIGVDINGDGVDDCGTNRVLPSTCPFAVGKTYHVRVYLNGLPLAIADEGYGGYDTVARLRFSGGIPRRRRPYSFLLRNRCEWRCDCSAIYIHRPDCLGRFPV